MNLLSLPEDILSHVAGFLPPRDFYTLKTVVSSGLTSHQRDQINCYYWWREEIPLARAAAAGCASLVRWVVEHDHDMAPGELVAATYPTASHNAHVALYDACDKRWPEHLTQLMAQWVELGNEAMFKFQISRAPQTATDEVFDTIYLHSKWHMLALTFQYNPHAFTAWAFGGYIEPADPEVIASLRYVLHHLAQRERVVLIRILNKYHAWIWRCKLARSATLQTIAALHALEVVPFDPRHHFEQALASPQHDYLEYLLLRGLEVEPDMLRRTYDIKKLKLLMTAQVVQKYQKIMFMLFILVMAIMINVLGIAAAPTHPVKPPDYLSKLKQTA